MGARAAPRIYCPYSVLAFLRLYLPASERPADALPNSTRAIELHQFVADATGAPYSQDGNQGDVAAGKSWYLVTVLFEMNFATYEWRKVRLVAVCLWGRSSGSGHEISVSEYCFSGCDFWNRIRIADSKLVVSSSLPPYMLQLRRRQTIPVDRLEIVLNALGGPAAS